MRMIAGLEKLLPPRPELLGNGLPFFGWRVNRADPPVHDLPEGQYYLSLILYFPLLPPPTLTPLSLIFKN